MAVKAENGAETFALTPYARSLGIVLERMDNDCPLLALEPAELIEGRPGAFHGGAMAGLLETAGYSVLRAKLACEGRVRILKPVNITVQYLSAGLMKRTYAIGRINRLGRRNANISVEVWQDNREKLVATAIMNILMSDPK